VYARLFVAGDADERRRQIRRLELGRSAMDLVAGQARSLTARASARDRERLDQYLTAARDLEGRLVKARQWEDVPRPKAPAPAPQDPPTNRDYLTRTRLMYEVTRLAFQSDSTRLVTLMLDGVSTPPLQLPASAGAAPVTVKDGYHNLSHHGHDEGKLAQLEAIEHEHMRLLAGLLTDLESCKEGDASLLDRTMVLYGSNMGDANSHVTTNLPVLLAGGGFKHGQHLTFDKHRNYPLPNLFVSMLQRLGLEQERFASSTGTFRGLELA
jgi:hypothetical protein